MRINKLLVTASVIMAVSFYACKHTVPEQPAFIPPGSGGATGGGGTGGGTGSKAVCFESEILPIFRSNCAKSNCHDATTRKDKYVLDSYDNLFREDGKYEDDNIKPGDPNKSRLYQVLFENGNDKMPPPGNTDLTDDQKNLIARWIIEGAKNTTGCNTSCDSNIVVVSYSMHIQPILQNQCTGCHSGAAPPINIDLTTYAKVQPFTTNGINSLLYGVIAHRPGFNPMPKGSLTTISVCEIVLVRKWVQAGAPNN